MNMHFHTHLLAAIRTLCCVHVMFLLHYAMYQSSSLPTTASNSCIPVDNVAGVITNRPLPDVDRLPGPQTIPQEGKRNVLFDVTCWPGVPIQYAIQYFGQVCILYLYHTQV